MSILKDMFQALKGGVSEVGEAVVDVNLVRILEQDIREDSDAINKAKHSLTKLKSTEIQLKRKYDSFVKDIEDYEVKAMDALDGGKEDLAVEVAERIAEIEADRDDTKAEFDQLAEEVNGLNRLIKNRVKNLEKCKRELEKIKTIEQLQKTTASINKNFSSTKSSANRVQKSLERVKKKQQDWKDKQKAGDWMAEEENSSDLDKKLSAAGIGDSKSSGSNVLARLKAKKNAA
ncbi:MAG: PspA/IM30 family protein [Proteobacteria bacterium]|nr:PspA/IM30 family protein [Pseudomonadota bacterium]